MQLSTLGVFVKQLINKTPATWSDDTGNPTNALITAALNDARNELYAEFTSEFPERFATTTTQSYTANTDSVTITSAVQLRPILAITTYVQGVTIDPQTILARHISVIGGLSPRGSTPVFYSVIGTKLYLRPMPSVDTTLQYTYVPLLTEMSADADTPSEFPADFHRAIGYLAAFKLRKYNEDPAQGLMDEVKNWKERLQASFQNQQKDDGVRNVALPSIFEGGWP